MIKSNKAYSNTNTNKSLRGMIKTIISGIKREINCYKLKISPLQLPTLNSQPSTPNTSSFKQKIIALVLIFTVLLPTVTPYQNIRANNNGPNAPEAASFEPVDATDMVNLVTGNLAYVLPLLNIPGPEGGYPLALSYHAGIAMDQEASWVGLGWNLNPGAINRSVNGYPDDWGKVKVGELYYDRGETEEYYNFSIGGILPNGVTIGVSAAWGDYKAWGGIIGYGGLAVSLDSLGPFNLDYNEANGFTIGYGGGLFSYNSRSQKLGSSIAVNAGVGIPNTPLMFSLEISLANNGIASSIKSSFEIDSNSASSVSSDDYHIIEKERKSSINLGFYWHNYKYQYFSYSLFKESTLDVSGVLNLYENSKNNDGSYSRKDHATMDIKTYPVEAYDGGFFERNIRSSWISKSDFSGEMTFPNYDNYSVSGQGISGTFSPKLFETVDLFGNTSESPIFNNSVLRDKERTVKYLTEENTRNLNTFKLGRKINFSFNYSNSSFFRNQEGNYFYPEILVVI